MNLPEPSRLQKLVRAAQLPALDSQRERLNTLSEDYARGYTAREMALVVAFVGATGAGKSTLINALAGAAISEEGIHRPTSRRAIAYAPDDAFVERLEQAGADVVRYRVYPGAPWSGQVFIDTPDLNSIEKEHRARAEAILEVADVALVVLHKGSVVEAVQLSFLKAFALRRRVIWVLNFADQLGEAARTELKGQVRSLAQTELGLSAKDLQVFAVSALAAKSGGDPSGELATLLSSLKDLARLETTEKVRRSNAVAVLRELRDSVAPALDETASAIAEVHDELVRGLDTARAGLRADFSQRLERATGQLSSEVRQLAAGRWWGPAAWWMKMSVLGSGGLATAAIVARRSLPLGIAVGAVTAAAQEIQTRTGARIAEQRFVEGDTDEDGTLGQAARAVLVGASTAAQHRGLPAEKVSLPSVTELLEQLAALRTSAWRYTQGNAVSAAVSSWWRWARFILLPVINLPVLALAAHLVYRVGRAYLFGPYLPVDYFLNASAAAVMLAIGGGWLASLSLSGAVRRVRLAGLKRFDDSLTVLREQLLNAVNRSLEVERDAATQLARLPLP